MKEYEEENAKKENIIRYTTIISFSLIFFIIYIIYLSIIIKYITKNYHRKKLCVFWIDYCIVTSAAIIFLIIYVINLILNGTERIGSITDLSERIFPIAIIISLAILVYTIINSLIFDAITAFQLSFNMNKIKKIEEKEDDFFALSEKFKNINIHNIINKKYTFKYHIVFIFVTSVLIIICFIFYIDVDVSHINNYFTFYDYFDYLLRYYHLITLIILIISILHMNASKKSLLKKYYYNSNRLAQKVYDVHFSQIVYFTDVLSFKLVSDLIINIPALFFLSLEKFNVYTFIISEFVIFLYIFLGGNDNLSIDKICKAGKINKSIQHLFCFKNIDFHFGEKDRRAIFEEFNFNYSKEEQEVLNSLNLTILKNIESNLIDFDDNEILYESRDNDSIFGLENPQINITNKKSNILDFKTLSEFYLIQKLIVLFFKTNKVVYESAMDTMNENCLAIKKLDQGRKSKLKLKNKNIPNKDNNYISNINRISAVSIKDSEKIKTVLTVSQDEIFNSIEEKEIYEELKHKFHLKNEIYKYKIESLLSSELFELFPFYQMKISTIIKSLNPARNIKLFEKFVKRNNGIQTNYTIVNKNRCLSVKSIKIDENDDKDDNKKEMEKNLYYTHDLYLMYEIYDEKDFVNLEELNMIISEYNKYLLSTVKNIKYSFLPLILGIFRLEIFDLNKIIIVYRNPLYFSNFCNFNHWINFYMTEEPENIRVSSLFNDVIDVNEIEIKNSLEICENDYDDIINVLQNDYLFLKKIKNIYPIINLFIGDENNDEEEEEQNEQKGIEQKITTLKINKNLYYEKSILGCLSNNNIGIADDDVLFNNLNNLSISNLNNDNNEEADENNDIINSLIDKEYYNMNGNVIRTIKIYFTNLFRRNCQLNRNNENFKINSESYLNYIQKQLIGYLTKKSLFNDEEKEAKEVHDNK